MAKQMFAKVFYPNGEEVPAGRLVAYGVAYSQQVAGVLVNVTGGQDVTGGNVHILRNPADEAGFCGSPMWVIEFLNLMEGQNYELKLTDANNGALLATTLVVVGPPIFGGTVVTTPQPNTSVCSTCVASGTANNNGVCTGTMTPDDPSKPVVTGIQLSPGPNWSIKFPGLILRQTYTMDVSVGGVAAPSVGGLQVKTCI
jgi:hypothetical protein